MDTTDSVAHGGFARRDADMEMASSSISSISVGGRNKETSEPGPVVVVDTMEPKHAEYSMCRARYRSFENWPRFLLPKKEDLCKAGFIYSGEGDVVYCFYCDISLRDWEPQDKPWVEHYKHSPNCTFLNMCKIPPSKDVLNANKGVPGFFGKRVDATHTTSFGAIRFNSGLF